MKCKSCTELLAASKNNEPEIYLCESCNELLEDQILRPDMWQRIARIIGPNHYAIHDDLYDEEGFPDSEEDDFDREEYSKYRIKRGGPYEDIEAYLDDILTRFGLSDEDLQLPSYIEKDKIVNRLIFEIETTEVDEFRYRCYQILSHLPSSKLVRDVIQKNWLKDRNEFWTSLARCVIRNYPVSEASNIIEDGLLSEEWRYPKDSLHILSEFNEEFAIDILSRVVKDRDIPVMYDLGAIVRCCNPSWEKLKSMILGGRPESLIAIDALWIEDSTQYERYFSTKNIKDIDVDESELKELLEEYLEIDNAPRIRSAIESVFNKYQITWDVE